MTYQWKWKKSFPEDLEQFFADSGTAATIAQRCEAANWKTKETYNSLSFSSSFSLSFFLSFSLCLSLPLFSTFCLYLSLCPFLSVSISNSYLSVSQFRPQSFYFSFFLLLWQTPYCKNQWWNITKSESEIFHSILNIIFSKFLYSW